MTDKQQTTVAQKLKCNFCRVKVKRWKTLSDGTKVDGFDTLKEHIVIYHPDVAEKMGFEL